MTLHYTLQFYDYWHTGSGLTGGTYADLVVNKTAAGLPLVPGKTIKGLLRHAAEELLAYGDDAFSQELINTIFGERSESSGEDRNQNRENPAMKVGSCWFSSAELPTAIANNFEDTQRAQLYEVLAATKIDEKTGTAEDASLRQMEVTIPLTLIGHISGVAEEHRAVLERCLSYVKRLGQNRSRGLGRCQFKSIAQ
jgi:CRISPR/Cas system CSM-associated protein Csm3 (group 7 of RAMP superfamily)